VTVGARKLGRGIGGISARTAAWLAWSLATLSLIMFVANVALYIILPPSAQPPITWGTGGLSIVFVFMVPFLAFPLVGALIASRRPHNPIGWICLAVGLFWMLNIMSGGYGIYGLLASPGSVPFPAAIGSQGEWMGPATVGLLGTYLILLFPEGRLPSARWRPLAWLSGAALVVLGSVGNAFAPGPLPDLGGVRNPFGLEGYPWMSGARDASNLLLSVCMLASVSSLVLRYRRSGGEVRQQIKWIAFAASVVALGVSSAVFLGTFAPDAGGTHPLWLGLLEDAITLSFAGVPIAVGLAVLKYRLYDIDVLINCTLVYGSLTALLALVYFAGVATTQAIFRGLTGQEEQPQLAIVVSTLAIAALFNALRRCIQRFIDRRFYRKKDDAAKTLESFSAKLRDETDLDALNDDLVSVIRETIQPAHVSLWLRPDTAPKRDRQMTTSLPYGEN
jgi:hypothetical protein